MGTSQDHPEGRSRSPSRTHRIRRKHSRDRSSSRHRTRRHTGSSSRRSHRRRERSTSSERSTSHSRSASRSRTRDRRRDKRRRDRSRSSSSTERDLSASPRRRHHSRRRHKQHKHRRDADRDRKHHKGKKSRRKSKERRSKKHDTPEGSVVHTNQWGQHGILYETDIYTKEEDFGLWLYEVKKIRPEEITNTESKRHFREYMEDYNTATLPHPKYYDVKKWEAEQHVQLSRRGESSLQVQESSPGGVDLWADEKRHRQAQRQHQYQEATAATPYAYGQSLLTRDQIADLRRIETERVAADRLRKMGYAPKDNMGVRYE
ncbi:hypothetical protein IWQ62_003207 [Dispira parvispora]|uniref:Uncharacterized protein n=1 Tax=Dispira parvispora TaxID=1520584 RepID=A0A9W8E6R5_9FUNG|nr:hypothetical protein IWQ62_003207 [Dispira parvispora]